MHPMVLLGDVAEVEPRFGPFKDSANLDARKVQVWCRTYHSLRNCFGRTRWNSKVTWVMWNLILVHLKTVLVSAQDRCTVYAKHTVASEIVLTHPMVLQGDEAQVEARLSPIGDSAKLDAR
jgi:hypothetical protein